MISEEMNGFLERYTTQASKKTSTTVQEERANLDAFMSTLNIPEGVVIEDLVLADRPARKYVPAEAKLDRALLCFHGGGYRVGSLNGYNSFMAHLALACKAAVYGLDYRLAPEHRYPAALDDAVAAFVELSQTVAPERIMLVGDSAGGGLALACLLVLKNRGLQGSGAAALLSAWLDGTASGESYGDRRAEFQQAMQNYAGEYPLDDFGISPLFGDHEGLPPLLIQVARDEPLEDDSTQLHVLALDAGVESRIEIFDSAFHDFQVFTNIPEARAAISGIGAFFTDVIV